MKYFILKRKEFNFDTLYTGTCTSFLFYLTKFVVRAYVVISIVIMMSAVSAFESSPQMKYG